MMGARTRESRCFCPRPPWTSIVLAGHSMRYGLRIQMQFTCNLIEVVQSTRAGVYDPMLCTDWITRINCYSSLVWSYMRTRASDAGQAMLMDTVCWMALASTNILWQYPIVRSCETYGSFNRKMFKKVLSSYQNSFLGLHEETTY